MRFLKQPVSAILPIAIGLWFLLTAASATAQPFHFTFIDNDLAFSYGGLGYADVDQDGDFDLVVGGNTSGILPFQLTSYVAQSLDEEVRSGQPYQSFARTNLTTTLWHNTVAWTDYNRDGHLDFLMTGTTRPEIPFDAATRLYRNNGVGQFQESESGIAGVYSSAAGWGDYDNDGDADLLLAGTLADETLNTSLYSNNGNGTFTAVETMLPDIGYGAVAWGDYDNDGDLDLVMTGVTPSDMFLARIYRNDGSSGFVDIQAGLPEVAFGSVDWGDYDNDGDLDLLITGGTPSLDFLTGGLWLYRNDQNQFNAVDTGVAGIVDGQALWGDYDSDGDLDMLVTGSKILTDDPISRVYRNDEGAFVHAINLAGLYAATASWGDDDSDGDLDIIMMGLDSRERLTTNLYRNNELVPNAPPVPPIDLQSTAQGGTVTLSWTAALDDFTPAAGLTYNLRVGTSPGGLDVISPMALSGGRRLLSARGNVDHNTQWTLRNLPPGTYFWSVQAIDHGFQGSVFAVEGTFTPTGTNSDQSTASDAEGDLPTRYALHAAYPNPFQATTTIVYDLPTSTHLTLKVYNLLGIEVSTLVNQMQPAGRQTIGWDGRGANGQSLSAGVYFVRMHAGGASWGQKIIFIK